MVNTKRVSKTNRGLIYLLICLGIVIVGLVAAIVAVRINQKEVEEIGENEPVLIEVTDYMSEAETIYDNDSANLGKVMEYFEKEIQTMRNEKGANDAYSILRLETEWLYMHDVSEKDRMENMMRFDYSGMTGANTYRAYEEIIELAESLGNSEVVAKYQELLKTVEEDYMEEYMSVQQYLDSQSEEGDL